MISVDIDPDVVTRALDLLRGDGRANVTVVVGDGRLGHPAGAPYDRLVAWASAGEGIPESWLDQLRPDGIIVAPLMRGLEQTVVRSRIARPGVAIQEAEIAGRFIPLTATPFHPWEESRDG